MQIILYKIDIGRLRSASWRISCYQIPHHLHLLAGFQLTYSIQCRQIEVNVVVHHPPLAAFASINVGYPKVCLDFISPNQYIQMLRAYLVGKVTPDANALVTQFELPV